MTSYQKLKNENEELKQDISNILSKNPCSLERISTIIKWETILGIERLAYGGVGVKNNFDGFFVQAQRNNRTK